MNESDKQPLDYESPSEAKKTSTLTRSLVILAVIALATIALMFLVFEA